VNAAGSVGHVANWDQDAMWSAGGGSYLQNCLMTSDTRAMQIGWHVDKFAPVCTGLGVCT
jgi:hypothetical protein